MVFRVFSLQGVRKSVSDMDEAGYSHHCNLFPSNHPRKLFIGGIHWNTTDGRNYFYDTYLIVVEGMKAYFEQFGQVTESHIMRDPTGKSRCFGFVNFADPSVIDVVLQKTHILDSKQVSQYTVEVVLMFSRCLDRSQACSAQAHAAPPAKPVHALLAAESRNDGAPACDDQASLEGRMQDFCWRNPYCSRGTGSS